MICSFQENNCHRNPSLSQCMLLFLIALRKVQLWDSMRTWTKPMLTISKPLSAGQAQSYHKKEFTSEQQSYWSRGSAVQGEWQGRLASKFGLSGVVNEEAFARLSQ